MATDLAIVRAGTMDALLARFCVRQDFALLTTDLGFAHMARHCALRVRA